MTPTLDERLEAYAATLDAAAERHRLANRDEEAVPPGELGEPRRRVADLDDERRRRARRQAIVAAAAALVVLAASLAAWPALAGDHRTSRVSTATSTPPTSTPTTAPSTTSVTSTPSTALEPAPTTARPTTPTTTATANASAALAPFFQGAAADDLRLQAIAAQIDAQLASGQDDETADATAIAATDPTALARTIPAGLSPQLETAVLVVWSELDSRFAALCTPGTATNLSPGAAPCFTGGTVAAQRFAGDLATARALAEQSPAPPSVAPDSHLAGDVAVEVNSIVEGNHGCGAMGGVIFSHLGTITWHTFTQDGATAQGDLDQTPFQASYAPGTGWTAHLLVC